MSSPFAAANLVAAHLRDGRVLKGVTQDFGPAKDRFHLFLDGDLTSKGVEVPIADLKAVFFVKSFEGDARRRDDYDFERARGQGRRMLVTFADGEQIAGYTMGYAPNKPGFFLVPADPDGNNSRIYVVTAATRSVEFVTAGSRV